MSTRRLRIPKYRHYKPKNLAVVRIDGRDRYLGKYESPESHESYRRLTAEWIAGRKLRLPENVGASSSRLGDTDIFVNELILSYWEYARSYYVKRGRPTDEQAGIRSALRYLRRIYGNTSIHDFGPLKLKVVRP